MTGQDMRYLKSKIWQIIRLGQTMPIFRIDNKNVLFIHIAKTGGTTIERYLESYAPINMHGRGRKILRPYPDNIFGGALPLQHFHGALLETMFDSGFFEYVFMVVREPLERLKSEFRHSRRIGRIETRLSFDAWTRLELTLAAINPSRRSNHYRPQAQFACLGAEVFHFEEGMTSILSRVCSKLGLPEPTDVPHERQSDEIPINVPPACRARVRRFYAEDYSTFGYA